MPDHERVTAPQDRLARVRAWMHVVGEERRVAWDSCLACNGSGEVASWPPEWWDEDRDGPWEGEPVECLACGGSGERGMWMFEVRERLRLPACLRRREASA